MSLSFRPYSPSDRGGCLAVFSSNVPRFFRDHERADFETFLDGSGCPYFVLEDSGSIVGCGGYGVRGGGATVDLCWGMIDARHHGRRLGEFLLLSRLHEVAADGEVPGVHVSTSHLTQEFFRRYGFVAQSYRPDGFGAGLDRVEMHLDLTPDRRCWIAERWRQARG